LKTAFKKIIYNICEFYFRLKFNKLLKNGQKICIFDIDNTIADTWPSFNLKYKNTSSRLSNLKPFTNMLDLIKSYYHNNYTIVFITARDYRYYFTTKNWLKKHNIYKSNLILVQDVEDKIYFLDKIRSECIYYDDLSFNHENGIVKYYERCIQKVKNMKNIKYHDYKSIIEIQNGVIKCFTK